MEYSSWFWDTAIGIAGIAVMFYYIMQGTKRKGVISHVFIVGGVIVGGLLMALAVDRSFLANFF